MTTVPSTQPLHPAPSGTRQPIPDIRLRDLTHFAEDAGTSLTRAAAFLQAGPGAMLDLIAEITRLRAEPVPSDDERAQLVDGLRRLAAWLESTPDALLPMRVRLLISMGANPDVEAFAATHTLKVAHDDEGNASADLMFGPVAYHVYGYTDFAAHCEAAAERDARRWADKHGLELRPAEPADPPAAEAKPYTVTPAGLEALHAACLRTDGRVDALPVTVAALVELGYATSDRGPYAWITDDGRQYVAEHLAREAGEQS